MLLQINGTDYEVADSPDRPLVWVLRDELGLTGTKFGCGIGQCGSCTVHIDGAAARSCQTLISTLEGKSIRTIEGLAETATDGTLLLHPVQQAFIAEEVHQCGWCQSAQMMTAAALLETNPAPSEDEIRTSMVVFCRCGTYPRIRKAISRAAEIAAHRKEGQA